MLFGKRVGLHRTGTCAISEECSVFPQRTNRLWLFSLLSPVCNHLVMVVNQSACISKFTSRFTNYTGWLSHVLHYIPFIHFSVCRFDRRTSLAQWAQCLVMLRNSHRIDGWFDPVPGAHLAFHPPRGWQIHTRFFWDDSITAMIYRWPPKKSVYRPDMYSTTLFTCFSVRYYSSSIFSATLPLILREWFFLVHRLNSMERL